MLRQSPAGDQIPPSLTAKEEETCLGVKGGSAADLKPGDGSVTDVPSNLSHKEP